jgi:hypothetical protein
MGRTEKRASERIPADLEVKFYCCDKVQNGRVMNISRNGMFIKTREMCFPFDSKLTILMPFEGEELHVTASLRRIEMSPRSHDGIGVELSNPSEGYCKLLEELRSSL